MFRTYVVSIVSCTYNIQINVVKRLILHIYTEKFLTSTCRWQYSSIKSGNVIGHLLRHTNQSFSYFGRAVIWVNEYFCQIGKNRLSSCFWKAILLFKREMSWTLRHHLPQSVKFILFKHSLKSLEDNVQKLQLKVKEIAKAMKMSNVFVTY